MSPPEFWGRRTFCVITGASKGIGRQLAVEVGRSVGEGSVLVLMARSVPGLEETKRLVEAARPGPGLKVTLHGVDLGQPSALALAAALDQACPGLGPDYFQLALIIHNAGSVGDVSQPTAAMADPALWTDYLSLNLVSVSCLNAVFLQRFPATPAEGKEVCVVNISSLCAVKPFKSMGYYCVGKAAREMFFQVLAHENPALNVLSYSPGPVDTDMIAQVVEHIGDPDMKNTFIEMRSNILTPEQTSKRLVAVLAARKYTHGDRVDYFDQGY